MIVLGMEQDVFMAIGQKNKIFNFKIYFLDSISCLNFYL